MDTGLSSIMASLVETSLPDDLLWEEILLKFCTFSECRRFMLCSKSLAERQGHLWQKLSKLHLTESEAFQLSQVFPSPAKLRAIFPATLSQNIVEFTMDRHMTDGFLHVAFVQCQMFNNLQSIRMRHSYQVSDFGLLCLKDCPTLQAIDIAFCNNTSYGATLTLRQQLPHLKLIRRQPEWLDGHFQTPFSLTGHGRGEIHTYYADGSFSFDRDSQSNGFVCELSVLGEVGDHFLGDKLQYNNFRAPLGWPEWTKFCYRPGVCLLRLDPEEWNPEQRIVLVGQSMQGLRAPNDLKLMQDAIQQVPLGESRYFHRGTHELLTYSETNEIPPGVLDFTIMISKMPVVDLQPEQKMPPPTLIQACEETWRGMQSYGRDFLLLHEERLNVLLSGNDEVD